MLQRKRKVRVSAGRKALREGKRLGKSAVSKGPARDPEHLARVRAEGCLVCKGIGMLTWARKEASEAHHVRCIGPRTMGVRVSDYLTVPLCKHHHTRLHEGSEAKFWREYLYHPLDPAAWISNFSPEGKAAIAALGRQGRAR